MYIHAVMTTALAFSIYDHDMPQHIKTSNNDAPLISSYTDFIQHRALAANTCLNIHVCLRGLFLDAKKYFASCMISDKWLDNNKELGLLNISFRYAPYGKIHVQSVTEIPLLYTWFITVFKTFKISTTIVNIDIPYKTLNCAHNHLCIYDGYTADTECTAKLCGRAFGKVFYFNSSMVDVLLALTYAKYNTDSILSIVYQVHSELTIKSAIMRSPRFDSHGRFILRFDERLLFVSKDNTKIAIYYYNTLLWNRLSLTMHNINCSMKTVLIYDGPNSKSKLLGEILLYQGDSKALESSLSIVSIFVIDEPVSICIDISVSTRGHSGKKMVRVSAVDSTDVIRLKREYEAKTENVFERISVQYPVIHKFIKYINIKMRKFVYTGNTEAGCYLGGIVIKMVGIGSEFRKPIGPLCGEIGRRIFEDERLDGLTLSTPIADIYIFLFSGQRSTLLMDMIISGDKCEGLQNLYWPTRGHSGYNMDVGKIIGRNSFGFAGRLPPQGCFKFQYFFDSLLTDIFNMKRHDEVEIHRVPPDSGEMMDGVVRLSVEIKMVSGAMPCQCIASFPAYFIEISTFRYVNKTRISLPCQSDDRIVQTFTSSCPCQGTRICKTSTGMIPEPCPNATFRKESFVFYYFKFKLRHHLSCAAINDGVAEITLWNRNLGAVCATHDMLQMDITEILSESFPKLLNWEINYDIDVNDFIYDHCSVTEFLLSDGVYARGMR